MSSSLLEAFGFDPGEEEETLTGEEIEEKILTTVKEKGLGLQDLTNGAHLNLVALVPSRLSYRQNLDIHLMWALGRWNQF